MPSTATHTDTAPTALGCNRCDHGYWVNPRNPMDRRPCFNCNPSADARSRLHRYHRRPYMAPAPVADTAVATESPLPVLSATPNSDALLASLPAGARGRANWTAFAATYPAEAGWLAAGWSTGNDFARSLIAGCARYGNLTPRQLAAVQRNLPAAAVDPVAALNAGAESTIAMPAPVAAPAPVVTIDAGPLRTALDAAAASGLRKVRLTLGDLEFRRGFRGRIRNTEGMIVVYERRDGAYRFVGNIATDGRWLGRPDAELIARIRETAADPRAAASAHGHDTGYCACCRRLLTDPPSVMAGIGPVCIRRFNWAF